MKHLYVNHDPISGAAVSKHWTLDEARSAELETTRAALAPGWHTLKPLIYQYDIRNGQAINPVLIETEDNGKP